MIYLPLFVSHAMSSGLLELSVKLQVLRPLTIQMQLAKAAVFLEWRGVGSSEKFMEFTFLDHSKNESLDQSPLFPPCCFFLHICILMKNIILWHIERDKLETHQHDKLWQCLFEWGNSFRSWCNTCTFSSFCYLAGNLCVSVSPAKRWRAGLSLYCIFHYSIGGPTSANVLPLL